MGNKIIYLTERDNWQKDNALNNILINHLKKTPYEIQWEDPAGELLYRLRSFENKFDGLPRFVRNINLRVTQLLYGLFHWNYFAYLSTRRNLSIELRAGKLKERLLKISGNNEIVILSRSAGGRCSSLIADELHIKHIICLSYPFKHPDKGNEPERYLHLANLQTPMLIVQGDKDEYGGLEVRDKYRLSPSVELFFVDTNHDFNLHEKDWNKVLAKINAIIEWEPNE
ncbi:alpha/beta family hydrolase [Microbacter margulisiae]|uniref:KANL3/Tex30 alpha/beta hydrolase-like domain-containing protein n=1 Tax=Microbacter margulisiae TaxID=1350067 RepID=A0A7W5H0W4_9PORP|nr:alpha/beta family hydrolase [Microbacter margulisiae]MBB3186110.1 hypothetical protein [Microbacter margulisiae]